MRISLVAIVVVAFQKAVFASHEPEQKVPDAVAPLFHSSQKTWRLAPPVPNEAPAPMLMPNVAALKQVRGLLVPPVVIPTMPPTFPICYVCQNQSLTVEKLDPTIPVPTFGFTSCEKAQDIGLSGFIAPADCPLIQNQTKEICNCTLRIETPIPMPTMAPTFPVCYVCRNQSLTIGSMNPSIDLLGFGLTPCEKVQSMGLNGLFNPADCPLIQNQTSEFCNCTLRQTTPTIAPVPRTASPTGGSAAVPSLVTSSPQVPSPAPFRTDCSVCKSTKLFVGNLYATVEFPGDGVFSCNELNFAGLAGLVNTSFCPIVQDKVVETCNCTPTDPPIPTPAFVAPTRAPIVRFPPYPTAGYPVCFRCQNPGADVQTVLFSPPGTDFIACSDPLNRTFGGFLDPAFCSFVKNDAEFCYCHSGLVPGYSPGFPTCRVCKNSSLAVGSPNLILTLPGQIPTSCLELQNAGLDGYIDSALCSYFQDQVVQNCGCTLPTPVAAPTMEPNNFPTYKPVSFPSPTIKPIVFPTSPPIPPGNYPFWYTPLYPPRPPPVAYQTVFPVLNGSIAPALMKPPSVPSSPINLPTSPINLPTYAPKLAPTFDKPFTAMPTSAPSIKTPVTKKPISPPTSPHPKSVSPLAMPLFAPSIKTPVTKKPVSTPSPSFRGSFVFGPKKVKSSGMSKSRDSGFGGAAGMSKY